MIREALTISTTLLFKLSRKGYMKKINYLREIYKLRLLNKKIHTSQIYRVLNKKYNKEQD